jgi:predicted porin
LKKTIFALAALGTLAGTACAQSSVTIYGIVDAAITRTDNGTNTTTTLDSGKQSGSRIGFKGTEDLGEGLSVIFDMENGFNVDSGAQADSNRLFNRQAWIGLNGSFGTIKAGRQFTPVYANLATIDPFGDALAGDSARIFNTEYEGSRFDNDLTYHYEAGGIRSELQYSFGEVAGNSSAKRAIGGFAGYKNGPIDAVVTYTKVGNDAGTDDRRTWLIGGNYNFGVVKPYVAYATVKGKTGAATADTDVRDWLLGLTAPAGTAGTVMASFAKKNNRAANNSDARQWAIGYAHALSKRTNLYTSYGRLSNDSASALRVPVAGNTASEFNVGIRHLF